MIPSLPSATDMARWTLAAQHPLTRQWCADETSRLAVLTHDHEFDLLLSTDLELAARRGTLAPGHEPVDLLNRWITISPELSALLSIRFQGGDAEKPFVDASVLSRPLTESDVSVLATAAVQAFGTFRPRYVRMWSSAPTDAFAGTQRDRRFMAAPVNDLVAADDVTIPPELSLSATTDLAHWDDAAAAYAAVDTDHPEHPGQASIQDRESLQESIDAGTLFDVLVNDTWAGWVGATTDTSSSLGLPCYEVQEIILAPEHRGRGYGGHLSQLMARELPERHRVMIGTIHANNRGALEAARRAGRHDVGGWLQASLRLH